MLIFFCLFQFIASTSSSLPTSRVTPSRPTVTTTVRTTTVDDSEDEAEEEIPARPAPKVSPAPQR